MGSVDRAAWWLNDVTADTARTHTHTHKVGGGPGVGRLLDHVWNPFTDRRVSTSLCRPTIRAAAQHKLVARQQTQHTCNQSSTSTQGGFVARRGLSWQKGFALRPQDKPDMTLKGCPNSTTRQRIPRLATLMVCISQWLSPGFLHLFTLKLVNPGVDRPPCSSQPPLIMLL
jgi:hypothetical protein